MRLLAMIFALALVAAACSSSGGDTAADNSSDDASADDPTTSAAADDSTATTSETAPSDVFDYTAVDYDLEPAGSALRGDRLDPSFPPPLVDPDDITSGGPPPDGIPPIDDPMFVSVADARNDFIADDQEGVVVVEINGDARAYPIQVLIWHEIVNDEIGGVPVTVTYCPLCNSAVVFERTVGDRVLDFGTSGELFQSALVMYDRQTETLWAHFTGRGIVGHYAGAQLDLISAQTLGFGSFAESFPDGKVLSLETGFSRPYGSNPYVGYDDVETGPIGGFISQPIDDQFESKARILGIVDGDQTFSITLEDLTGAGVVPVTEAGRNLVAFHTAGLNSSLEDGDVAGGRDVGQTGVYRAEAPDGSALTFVKTDEGFVDQETGSTWNILGRAVAGPLEGEALVSVPHLDTFWFSWSTYQPDQILITP